MTLRDSINWCWPRNRQISKRGNFARGIHNEHQKSVLGRDSRSRYFGMGRRKRASGSGHVFSAKTLIQRAIPRFPHLSDDAQNSFFNNLTGVSTETFEEFNNGESNLNVTFPGSGITANLSGGTIQNFSSAGRFAISSPNYYNADTSTFAINFTAPIAAFGFYGTDIGDFWRCAEPDPYGHPRQYVVFGCPSFPGQRRVQPAKRLGALFRVLRLG